MRKTHRSNPSIPTGCAAHGMSRRRFLGNCAACAGAAGLMTAPSWLKGAAPSAAAAGGKLRVRVLYSLHAPVQAQPDWPNMGFDFRPVMEQFTTGLAARFPGMTFVPATAKGPEEAAAILAADKTAAAPPDGYIVFQMNCWNRVAQTMAESGKPVLYVDFPYAGSGGFLVYAAAFIRAGARNVGFVCSPTADDLYDAVKCFEAARAGGPGFDFAAAVGRSRKGRTPGAGDLAVKADALVALPTAETLRRIKTARLLAVRDDKSGPETSVMGVPVLQIPYAEVNQAWAAADKDAAREIAAGWRKTAARIEGVSPDELVNSAAMYLGMKAVLKKYDAHGLTMNCLGGFYGGHIHAYPCLGFYEMNNEGLVGGCECDVPSAAAMTAFGIMTKGRPGYISDPVMDTAARRIIYAHCVASNKVFGPDGPANPYEILTHSEDRKGASVRSIMPAGWMTTTVELSEPRKEILFHRAKATGNDPDDRACRTKLVAEPVGDFEKLFTMWDTWGWHRVTFYGDLKEPVYSLAEAIGWKVVEEA